MPSPWHGCLCAYSVPCARCDLVFGLLVFGLLCGHGKVVFGEPCVYLNAHCGLGDHEGHGPLYVGGCPSVNTINKLSLATDNPPQIHQQHLLQGASTSTKTPQTNTAMPMRLVQTNNATVDRMFWWPKVGLIALGTQIHNDNNDISSSVGICGPGHTPYSTPGAHGSCPLSCCVAPDPPFVSIPNST